MHVKLWGVRGSLPAPLPVSSIENRIRQLLTRFASLPSKNVDDVVPFLESLPRHEFGGYGGHTSCIQVSASNDCFVVIDGGSGLRRLGEKLMKGACGRGKGEVHILMTHFHWDHLSGLSFFVPIFVPGNVIHFYAVQPDLESNIRQVFTKPFFPVAFEKLGAKIVFHKLEPRKPVTHEGKITFTPYLLDHPDPCWGYKIEIGGKALSYCVDTECVRTTPEQLGEDIELYRGSDAMIFDAQYTLLEAVDRLNWGHSAAAIGLDLALREKIPQVCFVHHDPGASDEKIAAAEKQARDYHDVLIQSAMRANISLPQVRWFFAHEEFEFQL
jgi:phosphoribosyl 1,2-cyclic phosphodiesterase